MENIKIRLIEYREFDSCFGVRALGRTCMGFLQDRRYNILGFGLGFTGVTVILWLLKFVSNEWGMTDMQAFLQAGVGVCIIALGIYGIHSYDTEQRSVLTNG